MEEIRELTEIKELEEKINEVRKSPDRYVKESDVESVEISELDEYIKLTDEEKKDKYSKEQQDSTDKLIEIIEKTNQEVDELNKQINNKAIEAYKAVVAETKKIESEIEENNKLIFDLDEQIKELKEQIAIKEQALAQLESTENYDKEEYAKLQKDIEELKGELNVKEKIKEVKTKTNNKHKDQLEVLQSTKQELAEEYKVVQHHMEIEDLTEKWREVESNRRKKINEYKQLQQTEKYINKDEETLKKANQLAKEILIANDDESKIANKQKEINQLINELTGREVASIVREENKPDINTEEALEEVEKEEEEKTKQQEDVPEEQTEEDPSDTVEGEDEEKTSKGKEEKTTKGKENTQNAAAPENQEEVASKDVSKKEVDPKEEFDDLCYKAKKGNLKDEEFDKLVEILKDPTSYDKFEITTGIIFNKSRRIFKSLEKSLEDLEETVAKEKKETIEQAKYVRDRVALEKNEKHWFWSRVIDFSEDRARLSEPMADTASKPASGTIGDINQLLTSEEEQKKFDRSYNAPSKGPKETGVKEQ